MNEYFYELIIETEGYNDVISDLVLALTNEAIEEQKGKIIVRSSEPLDDIKWAVEEFSKKSKIPLNMKTVKQKNENWIKKYQESIQPVSVGKFYIHPTWKSPKDDLINIIIDPALAFGSGHHETTGSCLKAIGDLVKKGDEVLDVGCGSGILSIACAKLGAKVDLCDSDPLSVESAKENFKLNQISYNDAWIGSVNKTDKKYDFTIANIIADVLIMISKDLKKSVKEGGYLILSGILDKYREDVAKKFDNFDTISQLKNDEWFTLVLKNCKR